MCEVLAAPASFLAVLSASHAFEASDSHFFIKLFSAAPANFLSVACVLHVIEGAAIEPAEGDFVTGV